MTKDEINIIKQLLNIIKDARKQGFDMSQKQIGICREANTLVGVSNDERPCAIR